MSFSLILAFFLTVTFINAYNFPIINPSDEQYSWMNSLIDKEFDKKKRISKCQINQAVSFFYSRNLQQWYQHFIVKNNQVFFPENASSEFKDLLIYLCECYGLPDLELICYVHDGLHESPPSFVPIFARCRRQNIDNSILLYYGYGFDWLQQQYDRVEKKIASQTWASLINKVHWRGNTTDGHGEYGGGYTVANWTFHPRGKLCEFSTRFPDLIDASFVLEPIYGLNSNDQFTLVNYLLPMSSHTSMETCLDYKYQVLISGIVSPWSSDWKIQAGRVIFKQQMPWEVYWDPLFLPWVHYIPVSEDLSDFVDKMLWAMWHDDECKEMAKRSRDFILTHAKPEHMALYCYKVLLRYAKLLDP